jgi:hypothetical protein
MTHQIIEDTAILTEYQTEHINNVILGNDIPWFFSKDSVYGDNLSYFSHVLIHRKEENRNSENNSPLTNFFIEIFNSQVSKHNIRINEILRASLNATFYEDRPYGTIHLDHDFEHNNFIMYLDTIENAGTGIFRDKEIEPLYISQCIKFNYVVFPGLLHAQQYPPPGKRRVVFVLTFK